MSRLILGLHPARLRVDLRRAIELADSKTALRRLSREVATELERYVVPELIGEPEPLRAVRARLADSLRQLFTAKELEAAVREELVSLREELVASSERLQAGGSEIALEGASEEQYQCFREVYCDPENPDDPEWCTWEEWCDEDGNPSDRTCWYFGADGVAHEQDCPDPAYS